MFLQNQKSLHIFCTQLTHSRTHFLTQSPCYSHLLHHFNSQFNHSLSPNPPDINNILQGRVSYPHLLQIHARIFRLYAHQNDLLATRLIGHYPPNLALKVFNFLQKPNLFPFNAIIRVLAEEGHFKNAFLLYQKLRGSSLSPNDLTFSFLLKACLKGVGDSSCVEQVYSQVVKSGFLCDPFVCNGLIVVYTKCIKDLDSARKLFDEMPDRKSVCCWTSLISGYAQAGLSEEALVLFLAMLRENLLPKNDTMVSVLSACSTLLPVYIQKWVDIFYQYMEGCDPCKFGCDYVNTVLVYLYGKLGKMETSRERFQEITDAGKRSVLSWNAMIGAYVQNGCALEGLSVFKSMMEKYDCSPNHVTMVSVLAACAEIGDLELGTWVHEYMRTRGKKDMLSSNVHLATSLIDMYCKCGNLDRAREAFDQIFKKDVVSFNAMIMGLAVNGEGEEALGVFYKMQDLDLSPNSGTLLGVLCACSHSGLLDEGRDIFKKMKHGYSVTPSLEHYTCYVDLLARVGSIEEALDVVNLMPFEPNNFVWGALLSGCILQNRLDLVQTISTRLVNVDPENSAGYVMLSNSFAVDSRWRDVSKLRWSMREKGITKHPGRSWISIRGKVHEFLAGCASHPQHEKISGTLETLSEEMRLAGL